MEKKFYDEKILNVDDERMKIDFIGMKVTLIFNSRDKIK